MDVIVVMPRISLGSAFQTVHVHLAKTKEAIVGGQNASKWEKAYRREGC